MTRFTCFTDKELDNMEYGFNIALDNTGLDTPQQILKKLIDEIRSERGLREKEEVHYTKYPQTERLRETAEVERHRALRDKMERLAMNYNYGMATTSCDDEKLVVLCMINKTLKDIYSTLKEVRNEKMG